MRVVVGSLASALMVVPWHGQLTPSNLDKTCSGDIFHSHILVPNHIIPYFLYYRFLHAWHGGGMGWRGGGGNNHVKSLTQFKFN